MGTLDLREIELFCTRLFLVLLNNEINVQKLGVALNE
jgi:hypothetical protein